MNGDTETLDLFETPALNVSPRSVESTAAPVTPARRWQPLPVAHPCPACGAWNWWSAGNGWTCRVCHPPADPRGVTATCFMSRGIELIALYAEGEPDEA